MERYDIRVNVWGDVSGPQYEWEAVKAEDGDFVLARDAQATVEALQAQLPAEMQECTILFKECEKGHGRLTATNWIDHGCQTCVVEALQRERDDAVLLRDHNLRRCEALDSKYKKVLADLDAERERSKRQAEEAIVVFAQLAHFQALVRALPVVRIDLNGAYYDTLLAQPEDDAVKELMRYRASLDATTPDSNHFGGINNMVGKGGDGE